MRRAADLITLAACLLLLLAAVATGWWQVGGSAPPVQVPMFYDAHYYFHRPWTQTQAAPGRAETAPVRLTGENRLTQRIILAETDRLLRLRLAGPHAIVSVRDSRGGAWRAAFAPDETARRDFFVYLELPAALAAGEIQVTVATEETLLAGTTGGDRLGAGLRLNEFPRPGNLDLAVFTPGQVGPGWFDLLGRQLLPHVFRGRLQQYKPVPFKGELIPALFLTLAATSIVVWLAASPGRRARAAMAYSLSFLIVAFLAAEIAAGALIWRPLAAPLTFAPAGAPLPLAPHSATADRVIYDWTSGLWTAERHPEERFIIIEPLAPEAGAAAIRVPRESAIRQTLQLPPQARLELSAEATGPPTIFRVRVEDRVLFEETLSFGGPPRAVVIDLAQFGGETVRLSLETANPAGRPPGEVDDSGGGLWWSPQVIARPNWLAPASAHLANPLAMLSGPDEETIVYLVRADLPAEIVPGEPLVVDLHWLAAGLNDAYPTVFVHLQDELGQILAQSDGPPLAGSYPTAAWTPPWVVRESRRLEVPQELPSGPLLLSAGLYEANTGVRWQAATVDGRPWPDRAVVLGRWETTADGY